MKCISTACSHAHHSASSPPPFYFYASIFFLHIDLKLMSSLLISLKDLQSLQDSAICLLNPKLIWRFPDFFPNIKIKIKRIYFGFYQEHFFFLFFKNISLYENMILLGMLLLDLKNFFDSLAPVLQTQTFLNIK